MIASAEKPVKEVVRDLEKQGAAMVMIDTPPLVTPQFNAALEIADSVILVSCPNPNGPGYPTRDMGHYATSQEVGLRDY